MSKTKIEDWSPEVLAALRIITALLLVEHALMKFFSFPAPIPGVQHPLSAIMMIAGVIEIVGAPLIILGLFTRPAAFLLSGEMAVAYFMAHAPVSFFPVLNMGEPAIMFCFVFLYLVFAGPGAWSVDGLRNQNSAAKLENRTLQMGSRG
jgi:putative oxidoreductase